MEEVFDKNKDSILKKQNHLKRESQQMIARIQKFMSHLLIDAQKEMHKNIDLHRKKFKKRIEEIET